MIALVILALMAGAALGVILMGMVTAGRREDECRACWRQVTEYAPLISETKERKR